jgi:lipopolysaccharide transport system permease protein
LTSTKIVLEPGKANREYAKDLWRYRELFFTLAWRNVSVRYKQTIVGVLWAFLRPVITTVVFSVVFGKLGKFPSGGVPYPILVLTGMLPYQFFSAALTESGNSLISNANLITKVYFPRLIVPGSALVTSLVDFGISLILLLVVMAFYGIFPGWQILCLPLFLGLAIIAASGIGAWVSALNVKYRDFTFIVPFVAQLGLYASPVAFSSQVIPEKWRMLYALNPMVGVIDGFRWCFLKGQTYVYWPAVAISVGVGAVLATTGFYYFRSTERRFADVI